MMEVQLGLKENIIHFGRSSVRMITVSGAVLCCSCRKKSNSQKIFMAKKREVTGSGEHCTLIFHNCSLHRMLLKCSCQEW